MVCATTVAARSSLRFAKGNAADPRTIRVSYDKRVRAFVCSLILIGLSCKIFISSFKEIKHFCQYY